MKSYIYSLPVLLAAMVATTSAFIRHPTTKRTPTGLKALNEKLVATALVATVLTGFVPTSDAALAPPPLVAGVEIVPSGGGGFGGLGISPFGVGPFGGFGFGFGVRPKPEPGVSVRKAQPPPPQMSNEETIRRAKAELEITKQREQQLDRIIEDLSTTTEDKS